MSLTSESVDVLGVSGDEATTVLDRIVDELDPVELHAIAVTATRGSTHYAIVAKTGRNGGGDVIDLRTVVIDLGDDAVRVTDNGMWIPYDPDAVNAVLRSLARTHTDMTRDEDADVAEPAALSAVATPASEILSTVVEDEDEHEPDGWGVEYGNGAGEPPEAHELVERLVEADLRTDRFSRLDFESKTPWERYAERDVDELLGNYGVETLEDDRLIVLDVDYPDDAPLDELPETYAVSSPNGDDRRAHHYYALPEGVDKHGLNDYYGSWALKPSWGDVWIAGEYVVGPGSRADGGSYDVVSDVPIATIEASELMSLVPRSVDEGDEHDDDDLDDSEDDVDGERREAVGETADVDPVVEPNEDDADDEDEDEADLVVCDVCDVEVDRSIASLTDRGDGPVYVCEVCHE